MNAYIYITRISYTIKLRVIFKIMLVNLEFQSDI